MTEDEERQADEVNIAFQMGAEWQMKRSKARIEQLEAELHSCFHRIEGLQAALREVMEISDRRSIHPMSSEADYYRVARAALEGKKND